MQVKVLCCWYCWRWNSYAMAIFNRSCSWWVAPSRVANAFLASLNSLSTICSPFANLICKSCRLAYWVLASSDRDSKATRLSSWPCYIDDDIYWNANAICCLRRSVWFVGVLAWCRGEFFPIRPGKGALVDLLMAAEPELDETETTREEGLNVEAWGVEVLSSSISWSDSCMISGWGEYDPTSWSAMVFIYWTDW